MVQLVSVTLPPSLYRPPPIPAVLPPVIVSPEIDAVTPPSTWNTRLCPPPLTVTPAVGPVIVSVPVVSLSSSWPAAQGDRLRRLEHRLVKGDRLGAPVRIRLDDRLAQVDLASDGRVGGVVHDDRGQQLAVLQRQQRRPHPPPVAGPRPFPARPSADPSLRCDSSFCRSSVLKQPLVMKNLSHAFTSGRAAHSRSRPTPPRQGRFGRAPQRRRHDRPAPRRAPRTSSRVTFRRR